MPIPDIQSSPAFDAQAVPDSTDWANLNAGLNGTGIVSGCVVAATGTPSRVLAISAGSVVISDTTYAIAAASVTIATASSTDRRDIICVTTGAPFIVQGTPCGTAGWTRNTYPGLPPVKPALAANTVLLADVYVAGLTTSITNADILNSAAITPTVQTIQGLTGDLTFYSPNSSVTISTSGASVGFVAIGGGAGSVSSVFGRTGIVTAQAADYSAFYDTNGKAAAASIASLPLTGGTMSGSVSMGTNPIGGISQEVNVVNAPSVSGGAVTVLGAANRQSKFTVSATTAITMSTANLVDGMIALVVILDGGSSQMLAWVNTENTLTSVPLNSKGSTTIPLSVLFRANGTTSKWSCMGVT